MRKRLSMNRFITLTIAIAVVGFILWPSEAQLQEKLGQRKIPQTEQQCTNPDRTFEKPTVESYRLDWCLHWGKQCGEDAAHAWCQSMRPRSRRRPLSAAQPHPTTSLVGIS